MTKTQWLYSTKYIYALRSRQLMTYLISPCVLDKNHYQQISLFK